MELLIAYSRNTLNKRSRTKLRIAWATQWVPAWDTQSEPILTQPKPTNQTIMAELVCEGNNLLANSIQQDRLRHTQRCLTETRTVPVLGMSLHLVSHLPQGFFLLLLTQPFLPGSATPFPGGLFFIIIIPLIGDSATEGQAPEHTSWQEFSSMSWPHSLEWLLTSQVPKGWFAFPSLETQPICFQTF